MLHRFSLRRLASVLVPMAVLAVPATALAISTSATYNGPDATLQHSYPKPTIKKGTKFFVGFSNLNGSEASTLAIQNAAKREAERLGGKFVAYDAAASVTTQVNQVNQMLAQHVTALVLWPIDPTSLTPSLTAAKKQKVTVVNIGTPPIAGQPVPAGYATSMLQGTDQVAFCAAQSAAKAAPGSTFATIGDSIPVPSLTYMVQRFQYWGKKFGLHFVGNVDTQGDGPSAGATAMGTVLSQWPTVKDVFAWGDTVAGGAATTASGQGKKVNVTGANGSSAAFSMIKSGQMLATFKYNAGVVGKQLVDALYDEVTHQHRSAIPKQTSAIGTCVTKANVSKVTPVG